MWGNKFTYNLTMQIPLGVLLKNETSYDDMTEILEHYQLYVPSLSCEKYIPDTGVTDDKEFLTTLLGGDYLSVSRARGAQLIRSTSELVRHTLAGILPVAEDWHAKVCFMEVTLLHIHAQRGKFYCVGVIQIVIFYSLQLSMYFC